MPKVSVLETTVTPAADGSGVVQLYISDEPRESASAAISVALMIRGQKAVESRPLAVVQRAALDDLREVIEALIRDLSGTIREFDYLRA